MAAMREERLGRKNWDFSMEGTSKMENKESINVQKKKGQRAIVSAPKGDMQ